jgi:hypothetical protein
MPNTMMKGKRRSIGAALLTGWLVVSGAAVGAEDSELPRSVQDLRYGVALYDFFQDNYFQALTELMLGEQKQDMPHHAEFASLLRGGISLSYGMDEQARSIFNELLAQHPKPAVRDRAWFYLGKSFYQRGDYSGAADLLARSGETLPTELAQEREYLALNIELKKGNSIDVAAPDDDAMSPWLPYLLYNLGVSQASRNDTVSAAATLARLAELPLSEDEHKALRDRAFAAAGYNYLNAKDSDQAVAVLSRVRLNSPLADKALLGYGWAHAQRNDFAGALRPWQTLVQKSVLLPAVQEGLLAVPYAYEQLNAPAQALEEYARAEQLLLREIERVEAAQQTLQTVSLLGLWVEEDAQHQWLSRNAELPVVPKLPYLEQLLARNDIQEIIRDMRDLRQLETHLGEWVDRLDALFTAQSLQHQRRRQLLQDRPDQQLLRQYEQLMARRDTMSSLIDTAAKSGNGAPMMDAAQLAASQRLERVRRNIDALRTAGRNVDEEEAKYARLRGALLWQVQDQFAIRRWELVKQTRALDTALADGQRGQARLNALVERARQPEQGERIHALLQRVEKLLVGIRSAQANGELTLRRLAVAEMQQQRERLQLYLGKSRLAMARLYDKGATEADSRPAPKTSPQPSDESAAEQEVAP